MKRQPIRVQPIVGPMIGVWYPYRKTPDLYIALDGKPILCTQCEQTFPVEQFTEHIDNHDRRNQRQELPISET